MNALGIGELGGLLSAVAGHEGHPLGGFAVAFEVGVVAELAFPVLDPRTMRVALCGQSRIDLAEFHFWEVVVFLSVQFLASVCIDDANN